MMARDSKPGRLDPQIRVHDVAILSQWLHNFYGVDKTGVLGVDSPLFLNARWTKDPFMKQLYQPSKMKRARKIGFRARMATVGGRNILRHRRQKGRTKLVQV